MAHASVQPAAGDPNVYLYAAAQDLLGHVGCCLSESSPASPKNGGRNYHQADCCGGGLDDRDHIVHHNFGLCCHS